MLSNMKRLIAVLGAALLLLAFMPVGTALAQGAQPVEGAGEVGTAEYVAERTFYLAEGCTRDGFETWLTVANLQDGSMPPGSYRPKPPNPWWKLTVEYTTNDGVVAVRTYDLPMQSRTTINVNSEIGLGYDVAFVCKFTSNITAGDMYVERPMYFNYVGTGGHVPWQGGHVNAGFDPTLYDEDDYDGIIMPTKQYFAEGTTRRDAERQFDEWICVLNPNDEPAHLTFNYMIQGEGLVTRTGAVEPNHRATWYVPDHVGLNKDVSLELVSDVGVLAERPMYFSYRSVNPEKPGRSWYGGHVITGVPGTNRELVWMQKTFAFAPVVRVPGMGWADTWVCLQNPNAEDVPVKLTFSTPGGLMAFVKWLPAQQRSTFYYPALLQEYGVVSTRDPGAFRVESLPEYPASAKVQVERPLYMEFDRPATTGQTPSGGTVISGSKIAGAIYAEGYTGAGFDTWVALNYFNDSEDMRRYWEEALVDNSGSWLQTKCYFPGGGLVDWGVNPSTLQASGYQGHWYTYMWRVNSDFPNTDVSIYVEGGCFSERIMIFSYMGKWSGMHSAGIGCRY